MQHPDYLIEFKPAIATFDWDQTYDILGFSYLPFGFNLLMVLCNIPAYEILAVDRFTPYDYLWAINYSDHLYTFVSYFNYCPNNSIVRRKARDIDDVEILSSPNVNDVIWINNFEHFNSFGFYTNSSYFIIIPKGKVQITWLTNEENQPTTVGEVITINQCCVNLNFTQDTVFDLFTLKEDFKNTFCANSLIFSQLINDQWVEFAPQGIDHNYLLYSDIVSYFWEVQQALIAYFDYVHTTYGYIVFDEGDPSLLEKRIIIDAMPLKTYLKNISQNVDIVLNASNTMPRTFFTSSQKFPLTFNYDYFPPYLYQSCFLQRANNDKWGLGVQLEDVGFSAKPNRFNSQDFRNFNPISAHVKQNNISFITSFKPRWLGQNAGQSLPLYPTLETPEFNEYQVNLDIPKNSYYLWDNPVYSSFEDWLYDNVVTQFAYTPIPSNISLPIDLYLKQTLTLMYKNAANNVIDFVNNTRFFYTPLPTGATDFRVSNIPAYTNIRKNSLLINQSRPYIRQINNSIYDIRTYVSSFLIPPPIPNPDRLHFGFHESFITVVRGKIPYTMFDLANELNIDDYLFFENLGNFAYISSYSDLSDYSNYESVSTPAINFTDTVDNSIEFELWTQEEYENLYNYGIISDSDYLIFLQNVKIQVENNMVDSVRVKEIHSCLGASEFSYINNDPTSPIYMHIARKVDYIAKALGLAFNGDGSIMGIRQSKSLENGQTIPAGWNFGQFGRNEGNNSSNNAQSGGNSSEERLGIVYDVRSNKFITNPASGEEDIKQGGYILCESIPQMLHIMLDDLDRALGLQTLGAIAITNQNYNDDYNGSDISIKTPYYKYNGLGDAFVEVMHTLADTHKQAFQANIGSLKSQAITIEILGALGVGCLEKTIILDIDDQPVKVMYPGFNGLTPSITDLHMWTLTNQSFLNEVIS